MFDKFGNQLPFLEEPKLVIKIKHTNGTRDSVQIKQWNPSIPLDRSALIIKYLLVESFTLDKLRPSYDATIMLCLQDGSHLLESALKVVAYGREVSVRYSAFIQFSRVNFRTVSLSISSSERVVTTKEWQIDKRASKNFLVHAHLPKDDVTVVLVDEDDQEYNTKYLDRKYGLSGGWRAFSMAHKLLAGDALVFQLIKQWKMKVNLSVIEFKDIKGVDDFSIVVDNLVIDSEIPKHFQIKYYDLCRSQNMYLHENLLKGLNVKLAVGIILETITIADAIRACKVTITRDNIATWDKTLKAFEEDANKIEQTKAKEEMRVIKEKLCGVQEMIRNLDVEMETLKLKGRSSSKSFIKKLMHLGDVFGT
ncbi:B3 DNA binding domain-containing protein [Tanacetum coccineum]